MQLSIIIWFSSRNFIYTTYRNIKNSKELIQIKSEKLKIFEMNVIDEKSILEVSKNVKKPIDYFIHIYPHKFK